MDGNALIKVGFDGFRELYISGDDPVKWDIAGCGARCLSQVLK